MKSEKQEVWRQWGIAGMPRDKRKLAEAVWDAAVAACASEIERVSGETYSVVLCEHKEAAYWLRDALNPLLIQEDDK